MRIIVTGAAGFIGDRLIGQLIQQNHTPIAMLHDARDEARFVGKVDTFVADITDPESLKGRFEHCDCVIHLAGSTITRSANEFHRINHDGTQNVANACLAVQSPPKLLYISSLAAGGPARESPPLSGSLDRQFRANVEDDVPQPVSNYGLSKLAAEETLRRLAGEMPIQIVRPPSVFGETDPFMRSLFRGASAGWVVAPVSADHRYSMIHVDDLCAALIHLAKRDDFRVQPTETQNRSSDTKAIPASDPNHRRDWKHSDSKHSDSKHSDSKHGDSKHSDWKHLNWNSSGLAYLSHEAALTFPDLATKIARYAGRDRVRTLTIPAWVIRSIATANSAAMKTLSLAGIGYRPLLNRDKMREALAGSWACDAQRLTGELEFQFPFTLDQRIKQTHEGYCQRQ